MNIMEAFGRGINESQFLAGTEYEIESVFEHPQPNNTFDFHIEIDHSLRNHGFEYKTSALNYKKSLDAFKYLMGNIKLKEQHKAFSERTSIHVHVNIGQFSVQQAKQLVLIYALLEPIFFQFVGDKRKNSIFCVPLNYTSLPKFYKESFESLSNRWHKYTAFNIIPVKKFGTVEFRHLYGTSDFATYEKWLTALKSLYEFVRDNREFQILEALSKDLNITTFAKDLVPTLLEGVDVDTIAPLLYDSSLDVKLAVGGIK